MRYKLKNIAALDLELSAGPGSDAGQCRPRYWCVGKDCMGAAEGDDLAREPGDNDPAGSSSDKCGDGEQGR